MQKTWARRQVLVAALDAPEADGASVARTEGDSALQSDVLEDLAVASNYRRWLVDLALPHLGSDPLEIGSGLGDYAQDWLSAGVERFTVSEADPRRLVHLRQRFDGHPLVDVRELRVPITGTAKHSAVVAYNVLEHVPDDVGALRDFAQLLKPGGRIVLVVPAFPSAMSDFDRAIGHQRRYRRRTLVPVVEAAGLTVEHIRYVNALGLLAWYVLIKALGGRPRAGRLLTLYDRRLVPRLRRIEARLSPPLGQSVFLVAKAPDTSTERSSSRGTRRDF